VRYASVCDGIGAVHAAWLPLGWTCAWHAEIDPFPAAVVEHRFGDAAGPNLGDMTAISEQTTHDLGPIDLLVGGTPCQSFSVAGLRRGMDDPRGNLALVFLRIAARTRSRWLLWENVPGCLSSSGGRDFGALLGGLRELGYGFCWRVLDAQHFGVPQRRRRVFLVGHAGDWRPAAAALLERESVRGHPPEERREEVEVAGTLTTRTGRANDNYSAECGHLVVHPDGRPRWMTPREAERLQGFPDDHTLVPWRGGLAKDSPRYKAIGNSMAVNVMAWLGRRIGAVEAIL